MVNLTLSKRAVWFSVIALILCFAMLVGTTYAWFTDSVTSAGNKIVAGKLDIDLYMFDAAAGDYVEISDTSAPIFGEGSLAQKDTAATLWEPGKTQVVYLKLVNNGNLDLKYQVLIEVSDVSKNLIDVVKYDIKPDAKPTDVDPDAITAWSGNGVSVLSGINVVETAKDVSLGKDAEHYFALMVHMDENAGNDYQEGTISFDVKVLATQLASESDSFDTSYDTDATYETVAP